MSEPHPVQSDFALQLTASQRRLYAYITSLVVRPDQAMDILQDTNRVLLEKADQFEPGTNFIGWAMRIAHFEVLAHRKRAGRSATHLLDADVIEQLAVDAAERDDDLPEKVAALAECMRRLSERQRQLIDARYKDNLTVKTIADRLGLKPNTATQSLHRARIDLLDCIRRRLEDGGSSE